jgi:CheY-like chemotaxis protein
MKDRMCEVMLVEDNPDHAELVKRVLESHRVPNRILHFGDGKEALEFLLARAESPATSLPDVILLDLRLTRVDGLEVLKVVKKHQRLASIPVVVLTSSEASRDIDEAYREHANSYLVKPVGYDGFVKLMDGLGSYWLSWNKTSPRLASA